MNIYWKARRNIYFGMKEYIYIFSSGSFLCLCQCHHDHFWYTPPQTTSTFVLVICDLINHHAFHILFENLSSSSGINFPHCRFASRKLLFATTCFPPFHVFLAFSFSFIALSTISFYHKSLDALLSFSPPYPPLVHPQTWHSKPIVLKTRIKYKIII